MLNFICFVWMNPKALLLCMLLLSNYLYAQLDNTIISDRFVPTANDSFRMGVAITYQPYMRNTEYFNTVELGRTLFGQQLMSLAYYSPHPHMRLQGGMFLQHNFGATPAINRVLPVASIIISDKKYRSHFIFGNIEGALSHQLIEPMFDIASAIQNRIEYGAQYKAVTERLFFDSWLNWQRFIEPGSPFKEQFTTGVNARYNLIKDSRHRFEPTIQATAFHRGGQIDTDTTPMVMLIHTAMGARWKSKLNLKSTYIGADAYVLNYSNSNFSYLQPAASGNGIFANLYAGADHVHFVLSYWQAQNWYNPLGTAIYQSFSTDARTFQIARRQLLIPRFIYQKSAFDGQLQYAIRYEPVIEVDNQNAIQQAFSLFLRYNFLAGLK